jgi:hypothetical protein
MEDKKSEKKTGYAASPCDSCKAKKEECRLPADGECGDYIPESERKE